MISPDGVVVTAKRRPGRRPKYLDGALKVEKSRQIARECRARKRLRYQYLEDLVKSKEKAIFNLRREIDSFLSFCKEMDAGNIPDCLYKIANLDAEGQQKSTSTSKKRDKLAKCQDAPVKALEKVDISEDHGDCSDSLCAKRPIKAENIPTLMSLLNGPNSNASLESNSEAKESELQYDNMVKESGSAMQTYSLNITGNMCNPSTKPGASMIESKNCSVQKDLSFENCMSNQRYINSRFDSNTSETAQDTSSYYRLHQSDFRSSDRFSSYETNQTFSFHSDPKHYDLVFSPPTVKYDSNNQNFLRFFNERPGYNAKIPPSKTGNYMNFSSSGTMETQNSPHNSRVLNHRFRRGHYCHSLSSQGNEDQISSSSSFSSASEMDNNCMDNSNLCFPTDKLEKSEERLGYNRDCMFDGDRSNRLLTTKSGGLHYGGEPLGFAYVNDLQFSLSSRRQSLNEKSPTSLANMHNDHKERICPGYVQNGHQNLDDVVDWLLQNESYENSIPSPPFVSDAFHIRHDNSTYMML